jgi:hypothetical protein
MKPYVLILLLIMFAATVGFSEIVLLKNGSTIVGTIVGITEEGLSIKSPDGTITELKKAEILNISMIASDATVPETPVQSYPVPVVSTPIDVQTPYYTIDMEYESRKRVLMYQERSKNPLLSLGLSLVVPGSGHFYTGHWGAGFFFLATRSLFSGVTVWGFWPVQTNTEYTSVTQLNSPIVGTIGAVGLVAMTVLECIDSFQSANGYNDMLRLRLGIDKIDPALLPSMPSQP